MRKTSPHLQVLTRNGRVVIKQVTVTPDGPMTRVIELTAEQVPQLVRQLDSAKAKLVYRR